MANLRVSIVGIKHRGVSADALRRLLEREIKLEKEPENKFDRYAVKCLSDETHFGYIEAKRSEQVTRLLQGGANYKVSVISWDEYRVNVSINLNEAEIESDAGSIPEDDFAGIYRINFRVTGSEYCYVGQSKNIRRRISSHLRDLKSGTHHNAFMQHAWHAGKDSFSSDILEKCPAEKSGFERQAHLFMREAYFIQNSSIPTANRLDADLVLDREASHDLKSLVNEVRKRLAEKRKRIVLEKIEIGQKFIDLGIMKEERFWDGWQRAGQPKKYLTVSARNILTWINKTRYSVYDHVPDIRRGHPDFDNLRDRLQQKQNELAMIDRKVKFMQSFRSFAEEKGEFETVDIKRFNAFLDIINENL